MKKLIAIVVVLIAPLAVCAEDYHFAVGNSFSSQLFSIPATLLAAFLFGYFIIAIIRSILDNRLKSKMIEKNVSDQVIEQILQPSNTDSKSQAMKWSLVLAGIGLGLSIVSITLPFGIHSIAIMVFCLALSFFGYFIYIKRTEK